MVLQRASEDVGQRRKQAVTDAQRDELLGDWGGGGVMGGERVCGGWPGDPTPFP
jgi:hypothetical protein